MVHARRNVLVEVATDCIIEGRTWAIAERPAPQPALAYGGAWLEWTRVTCAHRGGTHGFCRLRLPGATVDDRYRRNELAMQHASAPREFLCLTNTGLHVIAKLTPLDHLRQLLLDSNGMLSTGINAYFDRFVAVEPAHFEAAMGHGG